MPSVATKTARSETESETGPPAPAASHTRRKDRIFGLERWRSALLSLVFLTIFLMIWQVATADKKGLPGPVAVAKTAATFLAHPFYDGGPNDKGIGYLTLYSLGR